jgi:hypothetical protein
VIVPSAMRVADLVDLEAQLARDGGVPDRQLAARDGAIAAAQGLGGRAPREAVAAWLAALRASAADRLDPGTRVESALRWARLVLVALGLALGWGAMTALVGLSGRNPVNVWSYLLAFVFTQLILFLFTVGVALSLARRRRPSPPGPVQELLAGLVGRLAGHAFRSRPRAEEWRALLHRLEARRHLYARLEAWTLLGLGQAFGVAFNLAAVAALLRLVVFTDVAFSWSTTLAALDAPRFHAVVSWLAAPWGRAFPEALPSLQVVEATRYWHLDGRYDGSLAGQALQPLLAGAWWPFLLAATVAYGLLPRLAMLLLSGWRRRRALAAMPPGDALTQAVLRRLGIGAGTDGAPPRGGPGAAAGPLAWDLVAWRDAPMDREAEVAVSARLGRPAARVLAAGGGGPGEAARLLAGGGGGARGLALLAEGHEPPDKATLRFLREAREVLGERAPVQVLLVEPSGGRLRPASEPQLRWWRAALAALQDAYLGVEPLDLRPEQAAPAAAAPVREGTP